MNGNIELLKEHLPVDSLVEANIYDINLHDFAPLGVKRFVKFIYRYFWIFLIIIKLRNYNWVDMASKQVDDSMNRFLLENRINLDKREMELILSGKDVVDNRLNKAIISNVCLKI